MDMVRKTVLFIGEYNRGKTTLINALLGREAITVYMYPPLHALVYVHSTDGDEHAEIMYSVSGKCVRMEIDKVAEYLSGVRESYDKVEEFNAEVNAINIYINSTNVLLEKAIMVDSGGLNDAFDNDFAQIEMIPKSQIIVFTMIMQTPLSESEREIIKQYMPKGTDNWFFCLMGKDRIDYEDYGYDIEDEMAKWLWHRLSDCFQNEDGSFNEELFNSRLFYLDALTALKAKQTGDTEALEKSGLIKFENELKKYLEV